MIATEQLPSTVFSDAFRRLAEREADAIIARHRMIFAAHQLAAENERHQDKEFYS